MSYINYTDNIYALGTIIAAKSAPNSKLEIVKYLNRIYYCATISDTDVKPLAYFGRELIAPQ